MVQLPEVVDAGLLLLLELLHGHELALPLTLEDSALGTAAQPTELGDRLERDLPVICEYGEKDIDNYYILKDILMDCA